MNRSLSRKGREGQTFILVVLMTAILVILLVTAFDIFLSTRQKARLITAGDAGALAAAHWQGVTLNLIGELNLAHLAAACDYRLDPADRTNVIDGVNALAERLAFAGPLMGLYAANRAVEENYRENAQGPDQTIPTDSGFTRILQEESAFARLHLGDTTLWTGKGDDYARMLENVLADGAYVGCDNARLFSSDGTGDHIYYRREFYNAAEANGPRTWFCRYCGYDHAKAISMLRGMRKPTDEDLACAKRSSGWNAGLFGVGVRASDLPLADITANPESVLEQIWEDYVGGLPVDAVSIRTSGVVFDTHFPWFFLDQQNLWRSWHELAENDDGQLALLSKPKPQYDVYGAMAAVRVARDVGTLSGTTTNNFVWMAAAKPLGSLANGERVTDLFGIWNGDSWADAPLVVPAFAFTRLVSLGGVGANNLYQSDAAWLAHLEHLRNNQRNPGCSRCRLLDTWEDGGAAAAAEWLQEHAHDEVCAPPGKGGIHDDDDFAN
ncbi:MAG: hypothetical protein MJ240_04230 [Kiritimatiellae bacterium]|nr:hypothetical protein [Kiritimatiellia bacterium]